MQTPVLLAPGIGNSGPHHWQTHWEKLYPNTLRVQQADWGHPDCDQWAEQLELAVGRCQVPPVIVAHSLGCLVVSRWASHSKLPIHAALLVAVPDPAGPAFPKQATGFMDLLPHVGGRRITLVSSRDDPYSTPLYSRQRAQAWKAEHIELEAAGHINADSGLGAWPFGWQLVEGLLGEGK
jgi:predicted alpha/beta hydrolase family esterase